MQDLKILETKVGTRIAWQKHAPAHGNVLKPTLQETTVQKYNKGCTGTETVRRVAVSYHKHSETYMSVYDCVILLNGSENHREC